jgi:hypothetical protein
MPENQPMPDEVLADCLGRVVAELREEWRKELERISAEARLAVSEIRATALEILLEQDAPEKVARLRAVKGGGR